MERISKQIALCCALAVASLSQASSYASATVVLESASMGSAGVGAGMGVSTTQYVGWRFELETSMMLSQVGAHLAGVNGDLFAAVVRLDSIDAFPTGAPFSEAELLASVTFTPPHPSSEILVPLEAVLGPGAYSLVFGTGMFSANGIGAIVNVGQTHIDPTDSNSYIFWSRPLPEADFQWRQGLGDKMRFVVQGIELVGTADFNFDGQIDGADLAVWQENYGMTSGASLALGDTNSDGTVDGADFLAWQRQYGAGTSWHASAAAVPEPATMGLVAVMVLCVALWRHGGR